MTSDDLAFLLSCTKGSFADAARAAAWASTSPHLSGAWLDSD